jgi:uncharacterized protein
MRDEVAGPAKAGERHAILDALRGWALLGILVVNMVGFIGFGMARESERVAALGHAFDDGVELLIEWLVVGKFYSIFSLLFGVGFALQLTRLEQRGEGPTRYLRRLLFLFLFGLAHLLLLWLGDILALYALMGAVLLLFRRADDRTLLRWAVALWLLPILWSALIHFGGVNPADPIFARGVRGLEGIGIDPGSSALAYYREHGFLDQLRVHPAEVFFRLGDFVYQLRPAKVLGMFLIGLWVGRRLLPQGLEASAPLLRRVARWGLGLGLPLGLAKALIGLLADDEAGARFAEEVFYCLGTPTLALGYAAAFALSWRSGPSRWAEWAAPAGRMALTNYLGQTIIQSLIFYGWGLALIGRFGLVFLPLFALTIFALQVAFSAWWLRGFRFGPLEWMWRSATYGRAQPIRVKTA